MTGLLLVLLLIAVGVIFYLLKNGGFSSRDEINRLKCENEMLDERLRRMNEKYESLTKVAEPVYRRMSDVRDKIPDFKSVSTLEDRVGLLQNFWNDYYNGEQLFKSKASDEFFRELFLKLTAWELIKEMQDRVTSPFYALLNEEEPDAMLIRERLVKMALQMFDVVSAFQSPNQRKKEQGLNIGVVKGTFTEADAFDRAKIITGLEEETPRWIRNFARGVQGLGLDDRRIILSGYKFPPKSVSHNESQNEND